MSLQATIIIPVFNKKEFTIPCLDALAETLDWARNEIIVVDNASTDGTPEAVAAWEQQRGKSVRYIRNPENLNFARANNQGALEARGEYLVCLNNDTKPEPGWLEALLAPLRTSPDVGMTGAKLLYADRLIQHAGIYFYGGVPDHLYKRLPEFEPDACRDADVDGVTAACMAMRKADFIAFGGYDELFINGFEDVDLCIRVRLAGLKIRYCANAVVVHFESQTPGRFRYSFINWKHLNLRWAGVLPAVGPLRMPEHPARFRPSASLILDARAVEGAPPPAAAPEAVVDLMRMIADAYDAELVQRVVRETLGDPPGHPVWHLVEGILAFKKKDIAAAQQQLIEFLKRFPADRDALLRLANVFLARNELTRARTTLEKILRAEPWNREIAGLVRKIRAAEGITQLPFRWTAAEDAARHQPVRDGAVFSLVILTYNQWAHTEKCLAALLASSTVPYELILVDNASTDGTPEKLRAFATANPETVLILNKVNRGFPGGNNQGFAQARGRYVIWLNNDTIVSPGWLERLRAIFEAHPGLDAVGPVSNYVSGLQLMADVPYYSRETLDAFAADLFERYGTRITGVERIIGFCFAMKRDLLDILGGLDEGFGIGNFEDDDYCMRIRQAGGSIAMAPGWFVHHTGSQTFNAQAPVFSELLQRNSRRFAEKWSLTVNEHGYQPARAPQKPEHRFFPLPDLSKTHHADAAAGVWIED